jgi:hypothetical protein
MLRLRKVRIRNISEQRGIGVVEPVAGEVTALVMPDAEFLATFERGEFGGDAFPHRAHLRMAWLYVSDLGPEAAIAKAADGIRNLAQCNGRPSLYHDTLTRAWVYVVAAAIARCRYATFSEFMERNPHLVDKHHLLRYYSRDLLMSARARASWVAPDLRPIPGATPGDPSQGKLEGDAA